MYLFKVNVKFSDGDGPNLCRVKKQMLVPHLLKIYFDKKKLKKCKDHKKINKQKDYSK